MKRNIFVAAGIVALILLAAPLFAAGQKEAAPAPQAEQPMKAEASQPLQAVDLKFGAMPIGSSWYVYAATITKLLESVLPEGSVVEVVPQGGGIANPLAVSQGKADVALSNVATAKWAYDGIQMYQGRQAKNIRALAGGLNKVYAVVLLRNEFVAKTGLDSLEKIMEAKYPVRVIMKPEGSLAPPVARMILDQYGVTPDMIKQWGGSVTQVSGGQIPSLVREGRADLWFDVVPPGHPAVTEGMLTADLRFLSLQDSTTQALSKFGLKPDVIPAGAFANQNEPVKTVMPGTVIIAREDLPDNVAYEVTKIICENKDELVAAHASIKPFEPEQAWTEGNTGVPLHPGAAQYYRDKGWMK